MRTSEILNCGPGALTRAPIKFSPRTSSRIGFIECPAHQKGGSTLLTDAASIFGLASAEVTPAQANKSKQIALSPKFGSCILLGIRRACLITKASHVSDQLIDLRAIQFLAKGRHAAFAVGDNRDQAMRIRDRSVLLPPLLIGEIRSVECLSERRVPSPLSALTTGAVTPVKIVNFMC